MNNSRSNIVCLKCRISQKTNTGFCSICKEPTYLIGTKWRIPKKTDDKEWGYIERAKEVLERISDNVVVVIPPYYILLVKKGKLG